VVVAAIVVGSKAAAPSLEKNEDGKAQAVRALLMKRRRQQWLIQCYNFVMAWIDGQLTGPATMKNTLPRTRDYDKQE